MHVGQQDHVVLSRRRAPHRVAPVKQDAVFATASSRRSHRSIGVMSVPWIFVHRSLRRSACAATIVPGAPSANEQPASRNAQNWRRSACSSRWVHSISGRMRLASLVGLGSRDFSTRLKIRAR
jgi:hypothetical protein